MGKAVENQHRGGVANFAGGVFEHHFAVWRTVLALERLAGGRITALAFQLENAHVDDWVESSAKHHHYQLKRKQKPSWGEVADDFGRELANGAGSVTLVVPTTKAAVKLRRSRTRVKHAGVLVFPPALSPRKVLVHHLVRPSIQAACVIPDATDADLEHLWSVIDFVWQRVRKVGEFVDVRRVLEEIPDQSFPPLRIPWVATDAWQEARSVLAAIKGFHFHIDGGHFFHDDGAGERGRLSCRTQAFDEFVTNVQKRNPKTLNEVRELL
ncbi:MAG: hypothetical protein ACO1OB_10990 [Archangium sp.]